MTPGWMTDEVFESVASLQYGGQLEMLLAEARRSRASEADLRTQVATLTAERDSARAQALEEAAQLAEAKANKHRRSVGDIDNIAERACRGVAAAIRSLAAPKETK